MEQAIILSLISIGFLLWTYSFLAGEWESHKQRSGSSSKVRTFYTDHEGFTTFWIEHSRSDK